MKSFTTKIFLLLAFVAFVSGQATAQTVIWGYATDSLNSSFKGGLNDWTTVGVSSASPAKAPLAKWAWTATGKLSNGAYWGANTAIASPTVANGAAGFNSDFLDNGGVPGAFGLGVCPGPQRGELISPVINCTGHSSVEVKFNQYFRQFQTKCYVSASNDGGATWTDFLINNEIAANTGTPASSVKFVDISSVAANKPNVKIRFAFDGNYYFWLVDDVELREKPKNNLTLGAVNFCPASYATPVHQINTDTFFFIADIQNNGSAAQPNVQLKSEVFRRLTTGANGALIYRDSQNVGSMAVGLKSSAGSFLEFNSNDPVAQQNFDTTYFMTKNFVPGTLLTVGDYNLVYSVRSLDSIDLRPADNSKTLRFNVSANLWSKESAPNTGLRPGSGGDYSIGALYSTSPNWFNGNTYVAKSVVIDASKTGGIAGASTTVYAAKVADNVSPNFNNFITGDPILNNADLEPVGFNQYTFIGDAADSTSETPTIPLLDYTTTNPDVKLEPGKRYLFMASYSGVDASIFHGFNNTVKNYNISTVLFTTGWFFGGFGAGDQAVMRVNTMLKTSTDDVALPESVLKVYPSPANQSVNFDLNFEKATNINVAVVDLTGKVLTMEDINGVTTRTLNYDVTSYPSGIYLIRVECKDGTKTKRFVVQH